MFELIKLFAFDAIILVITVKVASVAGRCILNDIKRMFR